MFRGDSEHPLDNQTYGVHSWRSGKLRFLEEVGIFRGRLCAVQEGSGPIQAISAVTLLTTDMYKAVKFYETLGFALLYGGHDASFTSFAAGTGYLNLQVASVGPSGNAIWGRVVIYVDDVDAMHRRATAAGFMPQSLPGNAPWGERYFHIRDPDGHELSFARPLAPT